MSDLSHNDKSKSEAQDKGQFKKEPDNSGLDLSAQLPPNFRTDSLPSCFNGGRGLGGYFQTGIQVRSERGPRVEIIKLVRKPQQEEQKNNDVTDRTVP